MEPSQIPPQETRKSALFSVTPLSKYLAMLLFIAMPFIGGWVGYTYAPEKVVEVEIIKKVTEYFNPIDRSAYDDVYELYYRTLATSKTGTKQYVYDNPYEGFFPVSVLYKDTGIYDAVSSSNFGLFTMKPKILIEPYSSKNQAHIATTSPNGALLALQTWLDTDSEVVFCECTICVRHGVSVIDLESAKVVLDGSKIENNVSYESPQWKDDRTFKVNKKEYGRDSSNPSKSCLIPTTYKEEEIEIEIPSILE